MTKIDEIWPGYITPQANEIFTSWYFRLCNEHFIKTHSFSKFYLNNTAIWNRDIDQYCPNIIKEKIENCTILDSNQIKNLFLDSYNGYLFNTEFSTKAINDLGIYHRKRKRYGLMYCPGCLQEEIKYYKKNWRLASSIVCTKCNLYLLDCCPNCGNPICFHRLENGYKNSLSIDSMDTCSYCKKKLCEVSYKLADSKYIEYQNYIDRTLLAGHNDKVQYSFLYFDVLHILQNKLFTKSLKWNKIKLSMENQFSIRFNINNIDEKYSVSQRKDSFLVCYLLLQEWPNNFIAFIKKYNLNYSDFSKDTRGLPHWFTNIIKENL
jgi:hypothetical protein